MALSDAAVRAMDAYVGATSPHGLASDGERTACREAWAAGFEGKKLRSPGSGPILLAWAAGQRFPGAVPYEAPPACAEPPKPAHRPECRACKKAGKLCDDCQRQTILL